MKRSDPAYFLFNLRNAVGVNPKDEEQSHALTNYSRAEAMKLYYTRSTTQGNGKDDAKSYEAFRRVRKERFLCEFDLRNELESAIEMKWLKE